MEPAALIAAACLIALALAHSGLGESMILRPLFSAEWSEPSPRWAMQRLIRFAWHLTSIAWLAIAAALMGLSLPLAVAGMGLIAALIVFFALRGHLAWPLFALAGLASLHLEGLLGPAALTFGVGAAALTCVCAAALHFYWAAGGRRALDVAIPTKRDGQPAFQPPRWLTAAVGIALLGLAVLNGWVWTGSAPDMARWALAGALAFLVLRAIGDGRQVGFSKRQRATPFARWDDRLFTPLVVLLAFGTSAALVGG